MPDTQGYKAALDVAHSELTYDGGLDPEQGGDDYRQGFLEWLDGEEDALEELASEGRVGSKEFRQGYVDGIEKMRSLISGKNEKVWQTTLRELFDAEL